MAEPWWMPLWKEMVRNVDKEEYREMIQHASKLEKLIQERDSKNTDLRRRLARALRAMKWVNGDLPMKVYEAMYQERDELHARRGRTTK